MLLPHQLFGQQRNLRQLGRAGDAGDIVACCARRHQRRTVSALGQHGVAAQTFVTPQQRAQMFGHVVRRSGFTVHHVRVELRRAAHGLARVVDDEVEAFAGSDQFAAERFDAGRMAQVEAEDFQTIGPFAEVRLFRVACGRIAREARRDDQARACAQQFEPGLITDLHPAPGQ